MRRFKNMVLRRIFGPKRGKVKSEWRKMHSRELHNLYSSPRSMRWAMNGVHGRGDDCVQGFGGEPEGKTPLRKPRHRWEYWIRMVLIEIG
jgi:hypothetical protein